MKRPLSIILICFAWTTIVSAEDNPHGKMECDLTVTAAAVGTSVLQHRLLPAEQELREGNAAPILLRLPWEQLPFMNEVVPKFAEFLEIPFNEPDRIRFAGEGISQRMLSEMRRAAYRRTADWEYPINEEPQSQILLPDVQGARNLIFRGLAVRIRFTIVQGQLDEAREGILVGLANSRHYARTPFIICQLVAAASANLMVDRLEELIPQEECPNLYWSLAALPGPFIPFQRAFEFERDMLVHSVDGLNDLGRERTPAQWAQLLESMLRALNDMPEALSEEQSREIKRIAREELPKYEPERVIDSLSDGELFIRWFMARRNALSDRMIAYASLSPPEAIDNLRRLELEMAEFAKDSRVGSFFVMKNPSSTYLGLTRIDRRIAALRVVEGLRHYAATHDGSLPERLEQMTETPAPLDPATGRPFEYKADSRGGLALLRAPGIKDGEGIERNAISLKIKLKNK
jgi:hypothetical protein